MLNPPEIMHCTEGNSEVKTLETS